MPSRLHQPCLCLSLVTLCVARLAGQTPPDESMVTLSPFVVAAGQTQPYTVDQTVSATRVATSLMNLPFSMNILTSDFLKDLGATDIMTGMEYLNANTQFQSFSNAVTTTFVVRGFVADTLVNGFPAANNSTPVPNILVDRVEMLKGPASLLYGAIDPGGVVNIVTKHPLSHPAAAVDASIGTYGYSGGDFDLSVPVTSNDAVEARLAAATSRTGSIATGYHFTRQEVAPMLRVNVNPDTVIDLVFSYVHTLGVANKDNGPSNTVALTAAQNPAGTGAIDLYTPYGWAWNSNLRGPGDNSIVSQMFTNLEVRHRFTDHLNLRLAYAGVDNPFDRTTRGGTTLTAGQLKETDTHQQGNSLTHSVQLDLVGQWNFAWLNWTSLVGASFDHYANHSNNINSPLIHVFVPSDPSTWDQPVSPASSFTSVQALNDGFGQDKAIYTTQQVSLFDGRLLALLGGRGQGVAATGINGIANTANSFDLWKDTYQAGLVLRPWKPFSLYTNWSESFVPQNTTLTTRKPFDPVTGQPLPGATNGSAPALPIEGKGNEAGMKFDLLGDQLTATADYYRVNRSNIINTGLQTLNSAGVKVDSWQSQAGLEQTEGEELGLNASLWQHSLDVMANYTHTIHASLLSYDAAPAYVGKPIAFTPTSQWGTFAKYSFRKGWLSGAFLGLGAQYTTAFSIEPDTSPAVAIVPGYVLFNALGGYRWRGGRFTYHVQVNVTNLQDREVTLSLYSVSEPRTFHFTAGLNY